MKIIHALMVVFFAMPQRERIVLIVNFFTIITAINGVTFIPLIFNFKIIPGIERKIGQKLNFTLASYNLLVFHGYLARYMEISIYILRKLFKSNKIISGYALEKVKYPVKLFSCSEVFWSVIAIFNILSFCILLCVSAFLFRNQLTPEMAERQRHDNLYYEVQTNSGNNPIGSNVGNITASPPSIDFSNKPTNFENQ